MNFGFFHNMVNTDGFESGHGLEKELAPRSCQRAIARADGDKLQAGYSRNDLLVLSSKGIEKGGEGEI